jgi:ribose-phosphate pyrophosphokinase
MILGASAPFEVCMIKVKFKHSNNHEADYDIPFDITHYPPGEIGVKIKPTIFQAGGFTKFDIQNGVINIHVQFQSVEDLFTVALLKNALETLVDHSRYTEFNLLIPYFPFGRQDRVTVRGEAFSLQVVANYINSLNFDRVVVSDPHSYVTPAVIDKCEVDNTDAFRSLHDFLTKHDIGFLVSPDLGASKKVEEIGRVYDLPVLQYTKKRDLNTGRLSGFDCINREVAVVGGDGLIIDDICDGGGTFLGIAEHFHRFSSAQLHLYTTFGFYTKGRELLEQSFKSVNCAYDYQRDIK